MPTMSDIARSAGVSTATVSYVLNNRQRRNGTISEETRNRVLEVAAQLDYRANELARAVVTGKNRVLGLLNDNNEGENKIRVFSGAVEAANEHGYLIKLLPFSYPGNAQSAIEKCRDWRLAGLVAVNLDAPTVEFLRNEIEGLNMPLALVDNVPIFTNSIHVVSDDSQGIGLIVQHLYELGHRDIGFLGGYAQSPAAQWRMDSFRAHLLERELPIHEAWILHSDWWKIPVIEAAARELLRGPERPTAIVGAGDQIAMILLRVAQELGLNVPRDVSITGYANFYLSEFASPPLTTIDQSFRQMGRVAIEQLIQVLEGQSPEEPRVQRELLATQLIVRESTSAPLGR